MAACSRISGTAAMLALAAAMAIPVPISATARPPRTPTLPASAPVVATSAPTTNRPTKARLITRVKTGKKIVFLTLDDGYLRDPELLTLLRRKKVPVTAFLSTNAGGNAWSYWRRFARSHGVQNHTRNHPLLTGMSLDGQQREICGASRRLRENVRFDPWMMRPPYGEYNADTLTAAARCGIRYVVNWTATLTGGLNYQVGHRLRRGDIILGHFNPGVTGAVRRVIAEIRRQGFRIARLEDYLPKRRPSS